MTQKRGGSAKFENGEGFLLQLHREAHTYYTETMWKINFQLFRCHAASVRLISFFISFYNIFLFNLEIGRFLEIIK